MTIECSICQVNLLDLQSCTTSCGHVYHKTCLANWRQKGSGCPNCRKPINQITDLYFPEDSEQRTIDLILKTVVQINSAMEAKDRETKNFAASMQMILASVQSLSTTVNELKKENVEMKTMLSDLEFAGPAAGGSNEQMQKKQALVENLRKENQDLKIQRAEMSKQLNEIHEQVTVLKANRAPLKTVNGNEQPKSLTLSLKFDDLSDQLIINDLN